MSTGTTTYPHTVARGTFNLDGTRKTAWQYNDGGRRDAGYRGDARDCTTRAIAIATGTSYEEVYVALNGAAQQERITKRHRKRSSARNGVRKTTTRKYMQGLGWTWHPTMHIGSGCRVHLRADELPGGTIVCKLSRHVCTMIDGVVHDTYDPSRDGTRCVYGYWTKEAA